MIKRYISGHFGTEPLAGSWFRDPGLYCFILVCRPTGLYWSILVYTSSYWFIVYTGLYWFILVYTGLYWSVLVYTGLYWFILVYTDSGLY